MSSHTPSLSSELLFSLVRCTPLTSSKSQVHTAHMDDFVNGLIALKDLPPGCIDIAGPEGLAGENLARAYVIERRIEHAEDEEAEAMYQKMIKGRVGKDGKTRGPMSIATMMGEGTLEEQLADPVKAKAWRERSKVEMAQMLEMLGDSVSEESTEMRRSVQVMLDAIRADEREEEAQEAEEQAKVSELL